MRCCPLAGAAGHHGAAEKVPLRGLRRAEAARGRGPGHHHRAAACCWPTSPPARWTPSSTDELLRSVRRTCNRQGQTILMVTHSVKAASRAGRVLFIKDGQVFHQLYRGKRHRRRQFYQRISDTLTTLPTGGDRAMKRHCTHVWRWTSIRQNKRLYLPYLLTCVGMVMMFYIMMAAVRRDHAGGTCTAAAASPYHSAAGQLWSLRCSRRCFCSTPTPS